ncbi:MAG: PQQ-binding-like beta-propeller repeat protein [Bacteroidales bacterium]|jgi:outer membrane protein assembly factor BamB/calcineurin-like phosphoesterase family protein|nr:PQQ-binding-like beta-propeller repeat protein [Bacteroidales bacterium]MCI1785552.1 PQQ-binding-like beta-propeller repeat protein [Bacteroidales bacterium]
MHIKKIVFIIFLLIPFFLRAQEKDIRFAFVTDTHYSVGSYSVGNLRTCIKDINTLDSLDFVILGGDLTDFGTDEEIAGVKSLLDSLKYKYYVVAGNHDANWSESGCNTFLKIFGYEHFEFEYGGWRFIGCNCGPDMRMAPALIPKESMLWLKNLPAGRKTIFINHYPQDTSVLNYFDVTRQLKKIGVEFEIGGHWHRNTVLNYDGIPAILGRSSLWNGKSVGYNIVKIKGDYVTVSERSISGGVAVQNSPWYSKKLVPVADTVNYDSHGLPASYPWMKYDVNETYPEVREVWKFSDDANIVAGFARKGSVAYYTTASGGLRAISVKDGHRIWSVDFPGKIFSTPAVEGRYLVFGCTDGYVYAVNRGNGKLIWKYECNKSVLSSPAIFNGKVYIGASDGIFRALNLKDGSLFWANGNISGFVECLPYVDGRQVVFGSWANKLYSLDPNDGHIQWIWECKRPSRMFSPASCWPVKSHGRIFIAVPDRKMYAIDAATGKEVFHINKSARESIGLSEDGSTVYTKSMYHRLIATPADIPAGSICKYAEKEGDDYNLPAGMEKWNVETGAGYEISPTSIAEKDGIVLMPTDKGNLLAFSAADGSNLWAHKISIAMLNPMTVWKSNGKLFILASTMDGIVTLLSY